MAELFQACADNPRLRGQRAISRTIFSPKGRFFFSPLEIWKQRPFFRQACFAAVRIFFCSLIWALSCSASALSFVGLRDPALELLVLAIHDQLRLLAIGQQRVLRNRRS